ncbi:MAG: small multi-drug export protein [Planctomycetes bacterium]|nr:small multi-drug export protein [Planctomycetota bacterium]
MSLPANDEKRFLLVAVSTVAALVTFVVLAWIRTGNPGLVAMGAMMVSFQFAGKFVIFSGLHPDMPFSPFAIATFSALFDLLVAVVLATGITRLTRLPVVGPLLASARDRSYDILEKYPGLKRTAFWGVALFVFLPLPASGAVSGTFASILLGLPRVQAIGSIGLGSVAACYLFATLAMVLGVEGEAMLRNPWAIAVGVVVFAIFLWWAYKHCKRILERA